MNHAPTLTQIIYVGTAPGRTLNVSNVGADVDLPAQSSGRDYAIQVSTTLGLPNGWTSLFTNSALMPPVVWTDFTNTNSPACFHRVIVSV